MEHLPLAASAARTATGVDAGVNVPTYADFVAVHVLTTAVSGTTPSATFTVEWSVDGTTWSVADPADSFTAVTTAGNRVKLFTVKGHQVRLAWAVTGTTPSFTFSAVGLFTRGD